MPTRTSTLSRPLGRRIAALRAEVGLTQERLAWEAGLGSKGYLSRIESGERVPSLAVLEKLARRLGVQVRDLLIFPDRSAVDAAMERVRKKGDPLAEQVAGVRPRATRPPSRSR